MQLTDEITFLEQVEFDKILHLIEPICMGEPGRKLVMEMRPLTDFDTLSYRLACVFEILQSIDIQIPLPLASYSGLDEDIGRLHVSGYVLPIESFLIIRGLLRNIQALERYFNPETRLQFKHLFERVSGVEFKKNLLAAIDAIIDENGEVRADASQELMRIRKAINSLNIELDRVFRQLLQKYRQNGWLSESEETMRNGRRVFSVPAEFKRKISGIIHDESATGKTVYIESDELIVINNDIFSLHLEERKEIYKILKDLSAVFQFEFEYLQSCESLISEIDCLIAFARFSSQYKGVLPKLHKEPCFRLFHAYHPLLLIKNKASKKEVVPFDLDLHPPNRIVLLSGPNAGGKSVTMKATGLLQAMLQCGIPIPVAAHSEMGMFRTFYSDIGDKQSLEDDLSTYSSHLLVMKQMLEQADKHSLILIDEFGSGTDPRLGGAIAESILKRLNQKNVWGIVTTHYSNLKVFAFNQKGIVNAAMLFDREHYTPTYQFRLGKPGSSYAFEIARKSGLSEEVILYARKRAGEKENEVDDLLIDVQTDKINVEQSLAELRAKEKTLNLLMQNYEQARLDLEVRRKKWKQEVKETALQQNEKELRRIEEVLKQLKKEKKDEAIKELESSRKRTRQKLQTEITEIREHLAAVEINVEAGPIETGSHVRMKSGETTGVVESIDGKTAVLIVGELRMKVKLRDLDRIKSPIETGLQKRVNFDTLERSAKFETKLDIRGFRRDEALKSIEAFMDQAALSSATRLDILHGKGNGVLKKAVKDKLREYNFVLKVRHPEPDQGGDGITIAELSL